MNLEGYLKFKSNNCFVRSNPEGVFIFRDEDAAVAFEHVCLDVKVTVLAAKGAADFTLCSNQKAVYYFRGDGALTARRWASILRSSIAGLLDGREGLFSGILMKRISMLGWKKRKFLFDEESKVLSYWDPDDGRLLGGIYLPHVISIYETQGLILCILTRERKYTLQASSNKHLCTWLNKLRGFGVNISASKILTPKNGERLSTYPGKKKWHLLTISRGSQVSFLHSLLSSQSALLQGYLRKRSPSSLKGYQRRWFFVQNNWIHYCREKPTDPQNFLKRFHLEDCMNVNEDQNDPRAFQVVTEKRTYDLQAFCRQDRDEWVTGLRALQLAVLQPTPYDLSSAALFFRPKQDVYRYDVPKLILDEVEELVKVNVTTSAKKEIFHFREKMASLIAGSDRTTWKSVKRIAAETTHFPVPHWFPKELLVTVYFPDRSKTTVSCKHFAKIGDIIDSAFFRRPVPNRDHLREARRSRMIAKADLIPPREKFLVKFTGTIITVEDNSVPLHSIFYVRRKVARRNPVCLSLENKPLKLKRTVTRNIIDDRSPCPRPPSGVDSVEECYDITTVPCTFEVLVGSLQKMKFTFVKSAFDSNDPLSYDLAKSNFGSSDFKFVEYWLELALYFGGRRISQLFKSKRTFTGEWNQWLRSAIPLSSLPRETRMYATVYAERSKKVVIGWFGYQLFDYLGNYKTTPVVQPLWMNEEANPLGTCMPNNNLSDCVLLTFEMPPSRLPISFPPIKKFRRIRHRRAQRLSFANGNGNKRMKVMRRVRAHVKRTSENGRSKPLTPYAEVEAVLIEILEKDNLLPLSLSELKLLWKYKAWILQEHEEQLSKVLMAADYSQPKSVEEVHKLLEQWPLISPERALELLDSFFSDHYVRAYGVSCLVNLTDAQLIQYLPQLVQVLKYESYHFSPIACFLLERALQSRLTVGHSLFWHLKAEMHSSIQLQARYGLIMEAYLVHCNSTHRKQLSIEVYVSSLLHKLAVDVYNSNKRSQVLEQGLREARLPATFTLPIKPEVLCCDIIISKCKFMASNTVPLWLVFKNADPCGNPLKVIFKVGDDLRQDLLTMQMFQTMDRLWMAQGMDLGMTIYDVVATADKVGMIEIVEQATTTAVIQKDAGGAMGAFKKKPLAKWIQAKNTSEKNYAQALDNFTRSCAAYSIATYVIGIGDRHKYVILLTYTIYVETNKHSVITLWLLMRDTYFISILGISLGIL